MRLGRWVLASVPVAGLLVVVECAEPTAIIVEVHSEVPCSANAQVALYGARSAAELQSRAPSAFATVCTPEAGGGVSRGSVVLTPTGSNDETLVFAVVSRDDSTPIESGCAPGSPTLDHCIFARRQINFLSRTTMTMRVDLRLSCLGVACAPSDTCVRGKCVPASVDVLQCKSFCDEGSVGGGDAGAPIDAAPDTAKVDAAADGPYDSGLLPNPCLEPLQLVGEFGTWSGKVNVHRSVANGYGERWSVDSDCSSGANLDTITYCQKFWPATGAIVQYPTPTSELKPFTQGGGTPPLCGNLWPDPGLKQFGCCAP